MKRTLLILAIVAAFTGSAFAQKHPALAPGTSVPAIKSEVIGHATINSSLKSRGFIGPYEIVAQRERGLFGPSTVTTYIYDSRSGCLSIVNPSSSPGVGIAAVNGGALVGASFLFGSHLRPDQSQIQNGSSSAASASASSAASGSGTASGGDHNHSNNNNNDHSHGHGN
jgi:hypothetical protein